MLIIITVTLSVLLLFGVGYILLVMPRVTNKADMEMLMADYAHRGLWNEKYPENSLPAFARAVSAGYGIELDIQLSRDKRIMVFHDSTLKRMCGVEGKLCDYTYEELRRMKLRGSEYGIPTLSEVLRLVDGKIPLLIELKGESRNTELCGYAADMLDRYRGPFCVESFNPFLLSWFRKYRPRYARGQLVTKMTHKTKERNGLVNFILSNMLLNVISRPDFLAVSKNIRNTPMVHIGEGIFKAPVFVWTVKEEQEYSACRKEGRNTIFEAIEPK